jgi:hypothetical protein
MPFGFFAHMLFMLDGTLPCIIMLDAIWVFFPQVVDAAGMLPCIIMLELLSILKIYTHIISISECLSSDTLVVACER